MLHCDFLRRCAHCRAASTPPALSSFIPLAGSHLQQLPRVEAALLLQRPEHDVLRPQRLIGERALCSSTHTLLNKRVR